MEDPLSYTWGDTAGKQEITLNGRSAFVTQNLAFRVVAVS
jgi:hypothetical protein